MMEHPDETQLLDYVEEALPAGERGLVAQHVGVCSECWARIQELETARGALRESSQLELPPERRQRLLAALGLARAERRSYVSPMRLAMVLAPVAVVLTIAGAIVSLDGGGDDSGGDGGGAALEESGAEDAGAGGGGDTGSALETRRILIRRVAGPPARVAALLRRRGYNAVVEGNTVIVGEAPGANQALNDQAGGRVRVFLETTQPPG